MFDERFSERHYDAEIAYVDRQVARLIDFLKSHGLEENTLVVVAAMVWASPTLLLKAATTSEKCMVIWS